MTAGISLKKGARMFMAYDVPFGQQPVFDMMVTFRENLDGSSFLVSIPMGKNGEPVTIDENRKLLMRFGPGAVQNLIAGYADDVVRDGIRNYWKVRRVTQYRQFFRRADDRVKCSLPMEFTMDGWPERPDGTIEREEGRTLDLSYSGAAVYINYDIRVSDVCEIFLPGVGTGIGSDPVTYIRAYVCWAREAPKGIPYRLAVGLKYAFRDEIEKERMKLYVAHVRLHLEEQDEEKEE